MHAPLNKLVPSITTMIRADHTTVLSTFHKYHPDASPAKKKAIAETVCAAVEIHARLEEEIFYPAMRGAAQEFVDKSGPEHNEMRRQIAQLRTLDPGRPEFDDVFLALMRSIIHHVADEETVLLPQAERVLADRLGELGLRMSRRRMELVRPRAGEIALNAARTHPGVVASVLALVAVGSYLAFRETSRRAPARWLSAYKLPTLVRRPGRRLLGYVRGA